MSRKARKEIAKKLRPEIERAAKCAEMHLDTPDGVTHWIFRGARSRMDWWPATGRLVDGLDYANAKTGVTARELINILKGRKPMAWDGDIVISESNDGRVTDILPIDSFHSLGNTNCGCVPVVEVDGDRITIRHKRVHHDWINGIQQIEEHCRESALKMGDITYKGYDIPTIGWKTVIDDHGGDESAIHLCRVCNRVESDEDAPFDGYCVGDYEYFAHFIEADEPLELPPA